MHFLSDCVSFFAHLIIGGFALSFLLPLVVVLVTAVFILAAFEFPPIVWVLGKIAEWRGW